MASRVDYILNLNGDQARKVLLDLHRQGNNLFSKKGYELKLNSKGFNRSLDQATDRVLAFSAATQVLSSVGSAMRRLASDAITVETAISKIQSILNATQSDLKGFTSSIFDLANKTGVSFADAASAAEEFSRQGLSLEKTLKATEAALGLARVSGGNLAKTVQDLVAITSAFGNEALVYSDVADQLGALDAAFSTTTTGLAEGLARVASIANDVGVSFKEMSALIASTKQVTGRTEAVIGNAFKSIFTNIGTESVQEELRAIGVETKNLDGTFVDAEKVIQRLAEAYKNLTDAEQANITFKVAGKYNKNILQGAIFAEQEGVTKKALEVAGDAAGSIGERLKVLNDTTETSIQRLQNAITELGSTQIGGIFSTLIKDFSAFATGAADTLKTTFEKGNPIGEALSAGIVSVLKGPVLVLGSVLVAKLIKKITVDLIRASKSVFETNDGLGKANSILKSNTSELQKQNVYLTKNKALVLGGGAGAVPRGVKRGDNPFESNPSLMMAQNTRLPANYFQRRMEEKKALALQNYVDAPARKVGLFSRNIGKNERFDAYKAGIPLNSPEVISRTLTAREARKQKLKNAGFGLGFAAPILGSAIGSQVGGSAGRITQSAGEGIGLAALGSAFGPVGLALGAVAGGFQILSTVTEELYGNFEELGAKVIDNINALQKQGESGDNYVQAQIKYNQALEEGNPDLVSKALQDLQDAAKSLSPSRAGLLKTSNVSEQLKINEAQKAIEQRSIFANAAQGESAKIAESLGKDLSDRISFFLGQKGKASDAQTKSLAQAIAGAINKENIGGLNAAQSEFIRTGDSSQLQSFIGGLIQDIPEASAAFKLFTEKSENGQEALSIFIGEVIANSQAQAQQAKVQAELFKASENLKNSFSRSISRSSEKRLSEFSLTSSRASTDLQIQSILADAISSDEIKKEVEKTNAELQKLNIKKAEELNKLYEKFTQGAAETLIRGTQGPDRSKVTNLIGQLDKGQISRESFLGELGKTGLSGNIIKQIKDSFNDLSISIEKVNAETKELSDSEKKLSEARLRVLNAAKKSESIRNRFGDVSEDQSSLLKDLVSGRSAAGKFRGQAGQKAGFLRNIATANLSKSQADAILAGSDAEKALGLPTTISKQEREDTKTRQVQLVSIAQTAATLQETILGLENNKFQNPSDKARSEKGLAEVQSLVKKGLFDDAIKKANELPIGSSNKASVIGAIEAGKERFGLARQTAKEIESPGITIQQQIAEEAKKTSENTKKIADKIDFVIKGPSTISDSGKSKALFINEGKTGEVINRIKDSSSALGVIVSRIQESTSTAGELSRILPIFQESEGGLFSEASRNLQKKRTKDLGFFGSALSLKSGASVGGQSAGDLTFSKEDINFIGKTFRDYQTGDERFKAISDKFGESRSNALRQALKESSPGLENKQIFDIDYLNKRKSQIEQTLSTEQEKAKKLEDEKKALEASQNFKEGATIFSNSLEALSQGILQKIEATIGVNITGGDFASDTTNQEKLGAFVKDLFIKFTKETTGKEPVLAPVK